MRGSPRVPDRAAHAISFGRQHPGDFRQQDGVLTQARSTNARRSASGDSTPLEHLPDPPEIIRAHRANGGSVVHKHPLTCVAEFPPGAYHAAAGGYFES